jgi:hypothetical protein
MSGRGRVRRGKEPLPPYCRIEAPRPTVLVTNPASPPPRLHDRRGHPRHLRDERVAWVRPLQWRDEERPKSAAVSRSTTCCLPARFCRCMYRSFERARNVQRQHHRSGRRRGCPRKELADHLRMHPVDVVKDLRGRGYTLGSIRGAAGHWTMALTRNDAERYLAERREAGAP